MQELGEKKKMDINFTVTDEHINTGLRGIPVGFCPTSSVNPEKGLYYHDTPVAQMGDWSPEETVFYLMTGKKGSEAEVEKFSLALESYAEMPAFIAQNLKNFPKDTHPMKCLVSCIAPMASSGNYTKDAIKLIATLPELVATIINIRSGWGMGNPSNPSLGMMENFVNMLNIPGNIDKGPLTEVMREFHKLHLDHGGGNLSTFVGKAVASGGADLFLSLSGAMAALAGPKHGGANQDCLNFVKECKEYLNGDFSEEKVIQFVEEKLSRKELIFGFGHAVLRVEDPRATIFYDIANKMFPENEMVKVATLIRTGASKVLKKNPKVSDPYANVDAMSGTLLTAAGFTLSEFYTVLFGMSRMIGISMQIIYEREHARDGKGVAIYRPKYLYQAQKGSIINLDDIG